MGRFPRWQMSSGGVRYLLEGNSGSGDASFYIRKPRAKVGPSKGSVCFPWPVLGSMPHSPQLGMNLPDEPALTAVWLSSQSLGVLHLCESQVSFGGEQRNGYSGWSDYKQDKSMLIGRKKALGAR